MIAVIDTCSLLSLVRYYLPFDKEYVLYNYIKQKVAKGEIIIIDKVLRESHGVSNGIIISSVKFLSDTTFLKLVKAPYDTSMLVAPRPASLITQVEKDFTNHSIVKQKGLTETEYQAEKNKFLKSTDMTQIILCLNLKESFSVVLVTEETEISNDNKPFKKIPAICKEFDIPTMSLPQYLIATDEIELKFKLKTKAAEVSIDSSVVEI